MPKRKQRIVLWLSYRSKRRVGLAALVILLAVWVLTYDWPSMKTWEHWSLPLSGRTIALDAGHGGPDGGATSATGLLEKDINLAITLYLRDYLQEAGALVVMTRETDTDLADANMRSGRKRQDLLRRAELIRDSGADLFLTIHMNAIGSSRWYGPQTFYYANQHPDNKRLAELIQNEIKRTVVDTHRVTKTVDNVYLLKAIAIPSALVEVGFLSNPAEAERLADPDYQKQMAAAIYQAILRFASGEEVGS
ncbi:N-acetylmuramoyl-L-alanine amidase CwlD [Xylanibacillus composti]|uniref:Germination-specific N-acetylmuramoyl-L-alanine amidase n=1 Tax=Xylanibacillus composti TaxID=1572762 RepID=A0A8J4H8X0_9BACL|nr:N-acetylmuramoyl-L-alanine amidase CwlD [Xylanibacillus composti]MDT9727014.1 N-acetylmuramoyl-L-alanine amidase CwlD [Xylanibacillus composti]GIQ71228.1 germination-specific N-acetylmuramoyl-L-alanine amidase [Xylanibacillus composti]